MRRFNLPPALGEWLTSGRDPAELLGVRVSLLHEEAEHLSELSEVERAGRAERDRWYAETIAAGDSVGVPWAPGYSEMVLAWWTADLCEAPDLTELLGGRTPSMHSHHRAGLSRCGRRRGRTH